MADADAQQTTEESVPQTEQVAQEETSSPQSDAAASNGTPAESTEQQTEDPKPAEEEPNAGTDNGAENEKGDGDGDGDGGDDEEDSEDDRKLFVGGLSWETQEKSLKEYMSQYGEIQSCIVKTDSQTGRSRGFGFVVFKEVAGLDKALEARPHKVDERDIDSKKAEPQRREGKLFVGGVKPETEEKVIMEYFSQFGKIVKIDRPLDGRKKPKGFCFITFSKDGPISKIIKKRYHQLDNKEVECKYADPPHEGGGGGGGGRGRGRGRGQSQYNPPMQWFGGYGPGYPYGGGYSGGPGYVSGYGGGFSYGGGGGGVYGGAGGYGYGHPSGYGKARGGRHQNNYKPY